MPWEWSHTAEAYEHTRKNTHALDTETLRTIWAEWQAACVGHSDDEPETDFCERCYNDALVEAATLPNDVLADDIWNRASEQRICSIGGHEAWLCPFGCGPHCVRFDPSGAAILAEFGDQLRELIPRIKAEIADDYRAFEHDETPGIQLTVGTDSDLTRFEYQTGDNSFTGACYFVPHWAVVGVYRDTDPEELAQEICDELAELIAQ